MKLFSPTSLLQLRGYRPPPRFHQFQPRNLRHRFNNIRWGELVYPALFTGAFCAITPYILPYIVDSIPALKRNPSLVTIPIIGINVGIFFAHRLPRLLPLLRKYFLLVNARPFSVWSMLGSGFSHQSFTHLFFNMFCFQSFAPALCGVLGPSTFLLVYLGSIVCSSFASLAFRTISLSLVILSLGASGGIFGILGVFSYLFPNAGVALFFIPVPGGAWMLFWHHLPSTWLACSIVDHSILQHILGVVWQEFTMAGELMKKGRNAGVEELSFDKRSIYT